MVHVDNGLPGTHSSNLRKTDMQGFEKTMIVFYAFKEKRLGKREKKHANQLKLCIIINCLQCSWMS